MNQSILLLILSIPKFSSGNLLFLLILCVVIIATMASVYFFINSKSNKKRKSQKNNNCNELSINDYVQASSKHQRQIEQLITENKRLSNEIDELKKGSMQLISDKQDLEDKLNRSEVINQENIESNEVILYERQSQKDLEYYDSHDNGVFDRSTSKNKDFRRAIFTIEVDTTVGKLDILTGIMDSTLIADKDIFLEGISVIKMLPSGNADKIIVTNPGKVKLQGDSWVIDTKIQLEII